MTQCQKMSQSLDNLVQIVGAVSAFSGLSGSMSALVVDFFRRRVRAKAADYAAQNDFARIGNAVALLQTTIDRHIITSASQHSEVCQRVARLEGKHDA
jgi:hypothetical protein